MKILLLGSGGREHALAWKISQSPKCEKLYIAPGNAGTAEVGENVLLDHVILDKGVKILPGRSLQGYDSFPIVIRKNQTV